MANKYITDIIGNKNFQNAQNYVFPQKDDILIEMELLDGKIISENTRMLSIIFLCALFLFTVFWRGMGFITILGLVLYLGIALFLMRFFNFLLKGLYYSSLRNGIIEKMLFKSLYLEKKLLKENFIKIFYLGEGVYLIDKGKGVFRKTFYMPERLKFIKK